MNLRRIGIFILVALALAGCSHNMERVTLPPEAPMTGIQRIAVVGFANLTVDPGLGRLFEETVASILRDSQQYEVVDPATARAAMDRLGASPDSLASPDVAKALGQNLQVDAIITGSATYYLEDTTVSTPDCINCNVAGRTPYWYVTHTTSVYSSFQARLIRTDRGAIVWSNAVDGRDETNRTIYLEHRDSTPPSPSLIPNPDRSDIPVTRTEAVREAARLFTRDLLPRSVWVRKDG